ncbi:MAG: Gfo/Idh/MocA family oxidoreductase [candidate division Zixibacteria bacterium]|nr:Gfo/Idh/MocA family oxidoreductase [candidate division Zixibacteria bacterium]
MNKLRIGVIGAGYWGPNLIRNFLLAPNASVDAVADAQESRRKFIADRYPTIRLFADAKEMIADPQIDAVVIATPVSTHHPLAKAALTAGKHVLLEKPMCASSAECDDLIAVAKQRGLTLMVDHTFLYNGAVRKIRDLVQSGEIGDVLYFDSVRVNLGLFQHDVNVLWDLAPHDLSIMDAIMGPNATSVSAVGQSHFNRPQANIAYMTVSFGGSALAHFHVNWLAPVKVRMTLIGGSKQMIVYDDTEPSEKIKIYDKGVTITSNNVEEIHKTLVQYRTGDMRAPRLDGTEALYLVAKEFVESIRDKRQPLTDAASGRRVVAILEAADQSMKLGGQPVKL